ncbi:proteasome regulatory particle base subunit [Homalodisca vitripennis]|nr:proteasome regulatory particle base subunit [Homalodisca vitripennis]
MAGCIRTLRDSEIDLVISSDCDDSSECSDVPEPCEVVGGIEDVVRSDHSGSDGQVTAQQTIPPHRRPAVRVPPPWSRTWAKLGVNISNFPFSLSALGFHLGLGAIFTLFGFFWLQLNMFQTLKYLMGLGVVTFLCGNQLLARIAANRKKQSH